MHRNKQPHVTCALRDGKHRYNGQKLSVHKSSTLWPRVSLKRQNGRLFDQSWLQLRASFYILIQKNGLNWSSELELVYLLLHLSTDSLPIALTRFPQLPSEFLPKPISNRRKVCTSETKETKIQRWLAGRQTAAIIRYVPCTLTSCFSKKGSGFRCCNPRGRAPFGQHQESRPKGARLLGTRMHSNPISAKSPANADVFPAVTAGNTSAFAGYQQSSK